MAKIKIALPKELQTEIDNFFYRNPPGELPERLWDAARYAMGNKEADNLTNIERADIISFFKDLYIFCSVGSKFYDPDDDTEESDH